MLTYVHREEVRHEIRRGKDVCRDASLCKRVHKKYSKLVFKSRDVYTLILHLISVKRSNEAGKGGEGWEGGGEGEMGDSDSSDSDVIGPPLPPGYSAKMGGSTAGPSHSQEGDAGTMEEEESDDEEDGSVSLAQIFGAKRVNLHDL